MLYVLGEIRMSQAGGRGRGRARGRARGALAEEPAPGSVPSESQVCGQCSISGTIRNAKFIDAL